MPRTISLLLGALLLGAAALTARGARAAGACIPPEVSQALLDCSAVASLPKMSGADMLALAGALPARAAGGGNLPGASKKVKGKAQDKLAPKDFDAQQKQLEGAYHRFVCDDKPAPGDKKAREEHGEIEYARARLHFEAQHFQEAGALFRAIALQRADAEIGIYASQLYLESINVVGMRGEPSCYDDDMPRDVPLFLDLYCKDGKAKAHQEECDTLQRIQRDIVRVKAEKLVREADRGGPDAWATYAAAADQYLAIWTQYGKGPCEARSPSCARSEEILYNAARAYQAARDIDKAIAVRQVLIDPRYNLDNTELAKKALYEIGGNYQAMCRYDEAATWYERYARSSRTAEKAPEALLDATVLRLGLGQAEQALADAETYNKNYGASRPRDAARIAYALAEDALDHADPARAQKLLASAMGAIDRNATVDVQLRAHAALGRALAALGKKKDAAVEYGKVRASIRSATMTLIKAGIEDRALGAMLTVAGEAVFFFAEEKRLAADAIRLSAYAGTGRREDMAAYVQASVVPWLAEKRGAIDEAEKAYAEVLALQPAPPPRWVIASAARVARMHGRLAAELRATPAPRGWKAQGASPWGRPWEDVRADWNEAREQASAPELARAKAAHVQCVQMSVKYQWADGGSLGCAAWLSRYYPREYPRLDEIAGKPVWRAFAIESAPVGDVSPGSSDGSP